MYLHGSYGRETREKIIIPNGQTQEEYLSNHGTKVIPNKQTEGLLKLMKKSEINEVEK